MEVAQLILAYLNVLWIPVVILVIFFAIRRELKALLSGNVTAKYRDLEISLVRKDNEVRAIQENVRHVVSEVRAEVESLKKDEKWSGLDHEVSRLSAALGSIDVNSKQHVIISFLRSHGGESTMSDLVNFIIHPGVPATPMELHKFHAAKQSLDLALEDLKAKGLVETSTNGRLRLHPWTTQLQKAVSKEPGKLISERDSNRT